MKNIQRYNGAICRVNRERRKGHKSAVFWFTGLSGAGKSTIAHAVEKRLFEMGVDVFAFDGDNVRHGLCGDLDFSPEDRAENTRRIAEMSKLFTENGTVSLCAFISPMQSDRDKVRQIVGEKDFHEIYVSCPVEVCEERDVKGYYRKAREGKIKNYTGISAPYEAPENPVLMLCTNKQSPEKSVEIALEYILGVITDGMGRLSSKSKPCDLFPRIERDL